MTSTAIAAVPDTTMLDVYEHIERLRRSAELACRTLLVDLHNTPGVTYRFVCARLDTQREITLLYSNDDQVNEVTINHCSTVGLHSQALSFGAGEDSGRILWGD